MNFRVILFSLFFILHHLYATSLTLDFFQDKPRSRAKDFYIWQYLDQNISAKEAEAVLGEVDNMNYKLLYKFAEKLGDPYLKRTKECLRAKTETLLNEQDIDCIVLGLSPFDAAKLDKTQINMLSTKFQNDYPQKSIILNMIAAKDFQTLISSDSNTFYSTFNSVGQSFRREYYNHKIPKELVNSFSKSWKFNKPVKTIVLDQNLTNLQQSILDINSTKLNASANFFLALNAIKHKQQNLAIKYLDISEEKAYFRFDKDKALFWKYLITKNQDILEILIESKDINIYSLYAHEMLNIQPKNIVVSIEPKNQNIYFDITNPFEWIELKTLLKNIPKHPKEKWALKFNSYKTEPFTTELLYSYNANIHYFLMPYFQYLKNYTKERQALILAIARQESKFIPTSISSSYALGIMQFMPFVAKETADRLGIKNFQIEQMFDPQTAYTFANKHLDMLELYLNHPIFIAYAYNAGLGYTQRNILQKNYFTQNQFEPFISLELIPNAQARKYGKKVLANYVIYGQLLGLNIKLIPLLEQLKANNGQ